MPFYRMVAADSRYPRDGKYLENVGLPRVNNHHASNAFPRVQLGTFNPFPSKEGVKEVRLKHDRIKYWLSVGAQPSDRCKFLLGQTGILPPVYKRHNPIKAVPKKAREFSTWAAEREPVSSLDVAGISSFLCNPMKNGTLNGMTISEIAQE
jgi:small subunit ribosomal protein S16